MGGREKNTVNASITDKPNTRPPNGLLETRDARFFRDRPSGTEVRCPKGATPQSGPFFLSATLCNALEKFTSWSTEREGASSLKGARNTSRASQIDFFENICERLQASRSAEWAWYLRKGEEACRNAMDGEEQTTDHAYLLLKLSIHKRIRNNKRNPSRKSKRGRVRAECRSTVT